MAKTAEELKAHYTPKGHPTCVEVKGKTVDKRAIDAAIDDIHATLRMGDPNHLTPAQVVLLYILDPET